MTFNPVADAGWAVRTISTRSPTGGNLTLFEMLETIRSFASFPIELISAAIVESFASRCLLGTYHPRPFIADHNPGWIAGDAKSIRICFSTEMEFRRHVGCEKGWEGQYSILQINQLLKVLLKPIEKKVTESFSLPAEFIRVGIHFKLSEFVPIGILEEAAKKAGIELSWRNVPSNYTLSLELDKSEQKQLTFCIIHKTECGEISRERFTVEELENEWMTKPGMGPF